MILKSKVADFFLRMGIGIAIGLLFGWVVSEVTYNMIPNKQDATREPEQIELIIPYGTADQVEEGIGNRDLPPSLNLVQGDILIVRNEDQVSHQMGPLFIPANTSSVLELENASTYDYECSFVPTKNFCLTV